LYVSYVYETGPWSAVPLTETSCSNLTVETLSGIVIKTNVSSLCDNLCL